MDSGANWCENKTSRIHRHWWTFVFAGYDLTPAFFLPRS
jgi:hypothetical protein